MFFNIDDVDVSFEDIPLCLESAELGSWEDTKFMFRDTQCLCQPINISPVRSEASELDSCI